VKASIQSNGYRYKGSALILCALATKIAVGASLKNKAPSWKDFFFEEIHGLAGS
jgi:hypothetical protein